MAVVPSPDIRVAVSLICDLGSVSEWCDLWVMKLNVCKTKTMSLKVSHNASPLTIGETVLRESDDLVVGRWHVFNVLFCLCYYLFVASLHFWHSKCSYHSKDCMLSFSFIRTSTFNFTYIFLFLLDVLVPEFTYHPASNLAHLVVSNWDPGILLYIFLCLYILCNYALKLFLLFVKCLKY